MIQFMTLFYMRCKVKYGGEFPEKYTLGYDLQELIFIFLLNIVKQFTITNRRADYLVRTSRSVGRGGSHFILGSDLHILYRMVEIGGIGL